VLLGAGCFSLPGVLDVSAQFEDVSEALKIDGGVGRETSGSHDPRGVGFAGQVVREFVFPGENSDDLRFVCRVENPALRLNVSGDVASEQRAVFVGPGFAGEGAETLIWSKELLC